MVMLKDARREREELKTNTLKDTQELEGESIQATENTIHRKKLYIETV